jgi:type II secretory pathway pseudopilin PulG
MKKNSRKQSAFTSLEKADDFTPRDRRSLTGFTLVEVLLGFLIFSVLALVLYSTFFSGLKIQKRSNEQGAMHHQLKMTLDMITRELEQSIHFDFSNLSPSLKSFEGAARQITFLTIDKEGVIKRISYYLEDKDKVHIYQTLIGQHSQNNVSVVNKKSEDVPLVVLMRREEPFVDVLSGRPSSDLREEVLLDHIQRNSFSFLYAYLEPAKAESLSWQDVWDKDYLPSGIRIRLMLIPLNENEKSITVQKDIYNPIGSWGETL